MITLRGVFVLALVAGCTTMETPDSSTDVTATRATIQALDANAYRWIANDQVDSLVTGYYASDAVVMSPNAPAATGTDAIRTAFKGMTSTGLVRLEVTIARIYVADSLATTQGTYTFQMRPKPPADTSNYIAVDRGSYVTTFVRRNGAWRAVLDISTSDQPPRK